MKSGFTLIELAIVLIIVGLLAGGVLYGQNLIRAAELRATISQVDKYRGAVITFKNKYFYYPGDMPNATQFWGVAGGTGTGSACFTVESTGTETCDGSGDGKIQIPTGGTGVWVWGERYRFWQHLSNAGLIEGHYTGRTDSTSDAWVNTAEKNVPPLKMSGGIVTVYTMPDSFTGDANYFDGNYGYNIFDLRSSGSGVLSPLTPEDVWQMDTKIDDGLPAYGAIRTYKNSSASAPNCSTTDVPSTAEYDVTQTDTYCYVFIRM